MSLVKLASEVLFGRKKANIKQYEIEDNKNPIIKPVAISRPLGTDLKKFYPELLTERIRE